MKNQIINSLFDFNNENENGFFKKLIYKRSNQNIARFLKIIKLSSSLIPLNLATKELLSSYKKIKELPTSVVSLIFNEPTFNYWLILAENILSRIKNNENIPSSDIPYLKKDKLDTQQQLYFHFCDINRFIISGMIISRTNCNLKIPIHDNQLIIPYFGINIRLKKIKKYIDVNLKCSKKLILNINNSVNFDLTDHLLSFHKGGNKFFIDKYMRVSSTTNFSSGRIKTNIYDPYHFYETVNSRVFPNNIKSLPLKKKDYMIWDHLVFDSQKIIKQVWPKLENVISIYINTIVPLKSPDTAYDISCTSKNFPGLIFASDCEPYQFTEVIIHEFSHNILNDILNNYKIFQSSSPADSIFYSPWRPDPRPLVGILHALYVFGNVAEYYKRLFDNNKATKSYINKFSLIISRIEKGLKIFDKYSNLTKLGEEIKQKIKFNLKLNLKSKFYDPSFPRMILANHEKEWIKMNSSADKTSNKIK